MQKQFLSMFLILVLIPSALACQTNEIPLAPALSSSTTDGNVTIYDFNVNCTSGTAPLHTDFACNVSGNVTSYQWVFSPVCSDYFSKHQVTALHTFQTPGIYNITLTVVEANGEKASLTKVGYINVTGYTNPKTCNPTPCTPKSCSTSCGTKAKTCGEKNVTNAITFKCKGFTSNNISSIKWNFGDNTTYTTKSICVKHTYHKTGKCSVGVVINYKNGKTCRGNTTVSV